MGFRAVIVILSVLGAIWACDARELDSTSIFSGATDQNSLDSVLQVNADSERKTQVFKVEKKEDICTLCKEFTSMALSYLEANKTQKEILHVLHDSCSKLKSMEEECLLLVDYYAPLFFLEISFIQPGDFCQKVNICEQVALISQHVSKDSCEFCQHTVAEALEKLKDPDTELEIIEMLLKACQAAKGYETKCKRMVFEYGPIILLNAEHLLESSDICTMLHACNSPQANTKQALAAE